MEINVLIFGQLADAAGTGSLKMPGISNTAELKQMLGEKYPHLKSLEYSIAVNKKIIQESRPLNDGDIVALLPPFSGG